MTDSHAPERRHFLRRSAHFAATGVLPALAAHARASTTQAGMATGARTLSLVHTHTHENIALAYAVGANYVPEALGSLNRFLRDHYSGEVGVMDPQMFDLIHRVKELLGSAQAFEVISGYRGAATNARLRQTRGGGVATHSLHMDGRAIDLRLPGVALSDLRDAALSLRLGGVGFYPREQFVHLDTGRVRRW